MLAVHLFTLLLMALLLIGARGYVNAGAQVDAVTYVNHMIVSVDGGPEQRVVEGIPVVCAAIEMPGAYRVADALHLEKAHNDGSHRRIEEYHQIQQDGRSQEQDQHAPVSAVQRTYTRLLFMIRHDLQPPFTF